MSRPELAWADVSACTLPTAERPLRLAEFDSVFARHLVSVVSTSSIEATMTFAGGEDTRRALAELTARESQCCSFFDFAVATIGDEVELRVGVPATQVDVLAALVARAAVMRAGNRS